MELRWDSQWVALRWGCVLFRDRDRDCAVELAPQGHCRDLQTVGSDLNIAE